MNAANMLTSDSNEKLKEVNIIQPSNIYKKNNMDYYMNIILIIIIVDVFISYFSSCYFFKTILISKHVKFNLDGNTNF